MASKMDSAFMLAHRLLKWTKTAPVDCESHFPIKGKIVCCNLQDDL